MRATGPENPLATVGGRHAGDRFSILWFYLAQSWHPAAWVGFPNPFLSGPAGYPRENLSLIGTGLTGLLALGALDFHP